MTDEYDCETCKDRGFYYPEGAEKQRCPDCNAEPAITCSICPNTIDLTNPGALLFGNPDSIENGELVEKHHICPDCFKELVEEFGLE